MPATGQGSHLKKAPKPNFHDQNPDLDYGKQVGLVTQNSDFAKPSVASGTINHWDPLAGKMVHLGPNQHSWWSQCWFPVLYRTSPCHGASPSHPHICIEPPTILLWPFALN